MKILIQRVREAQVVVENNIVGKIEAGLLVFIGITHTDTATEIKWLVNKLVNLRIFEDDEGKINLSVLASKGSILVVSQFTLYGDCQQGRRPSFSAAAPSLLANTLYELFIQEIRKEGIHVECGIFGAYMKVALINDGPFTLLLEK